MSGALMRCSAYLPAQMQMVYMLICDTAAITIASILTYLATLWRPTCTAHFPGHWIKPKSDDIRVFLMFASRSPLPRIDTLPLVIYFTAFYIPCMHYPFQEITLHSISHFRPATACKPTLAKCWDERDDFDQRAETQNFNKCTGHRWFFCSK